MSAHLWLIVPLAPLLAGLLLWRYPAHGRLAIALAPLPALLAACVPPPALELGWLWLPSLWGAEDWVSRILLGFTALLWLLAGLYAAADSHLRSRGFWLFWLLALAGNLLLIIAADSASFYVGFTLMSLSAYGLIIHNATPEARQAGRLYLQLAILGEMLLFAGLMLRVQEAGGELHFSQWREVPTGLLTSMLILVGLGLKAGFWPLHIWLPYAHPAAPAAASAVLSGTMIKAGILGLWQFLPNTGPGFDHAPMIILALGIISAFYGAALGLIQTRAKTALAYSSVSQMGYMLILLALAWQHPEARLALGTLLALYAAHHGLAKGALFMGAGLAAHYRLGSAFWLLMLLTALALAGLPLTSGGQVKTLLKTHMAASDFSAWVWLLSLGSIATLLVAARALWLLWRNRPTEAQSAPRAQLLPWALLAVCPLLAPWLWPLIIEDAHTAPSSLAKGWALLWPLLLAGAIVIFALRSKLRRPAIFDNLPEPARAASLRLKKYLRPSPNRPEPLHNKQRWRRWERRWNRFWQQDPLFLSIWLLAALLALGWLW